MNGKEFKEEISKIEEINNSQTYFAIDKGNESKLIDFMLENEIYFQQYQDYGLLFADKEGTSIVNAKIRDGAFNIPDDKELKVSPVTFVNKVMTSVYDKVICEYISDDISNEVESVFNRLMDNTIDVTDIVTEEIVIK